MGKLINATLKFFDAASPQGHQRLQQDIADRLDTIRNGEPSSDDQLSPNRKALAEITVQWDTQVARLETISKPLRDLATARDRLRRAEVADADLTVVENARLDAWVADPSGPMPPTLDAEREPLTAEIITSKALLAAQERASSAVDEVLRREQNALAELTRKRNHLTALVLLDEIAALGETIQTLACINSAVEGALDGLLGDLQRRVWIAPTSNTSYRDSQQHSDDLALRDAIERAKNGGGSFAETETSKLRLRGVHHQNLAVLLALRDQLSGDATATFSLDPVDHSTVVVTPVPKADFTWAPRYARDHGH